MAADQTPPDDDGPLDWDALRATARRLLDKRMSGFDRDEIEDAVQEVCQRMLGFLDRHGPPRRPVGLLIRLVRCVAANKIAERQWERQAIARTDFAEFDVPSPGDAEDEILEDYRAIVAFVLEYLRLKRAGCVPIAEALARGETLKKYAECHGLSYDQVRQAWSRCKRQIQEAMRKKRLRFPWSNPRDKNRRPPHD